MKNLFVFALFPFFLSAQSEYLDNAAIGVKADYVVSLSRDFSGKGADIGISLSNEVDIGFEFIKLTYDPKYNLESEGGMVYAAYNFRNNYNCIKLLMGYSENQVNTRIFNAPFFEVLSGPIVGIIVSPRIYEINSIRLLPSFSFSMAFLSSSSKYILDDGGNHNISAGLEFNIIPKIYKELYFVLAPSISKSLSHSEVPLIYGFNFGLLFNLQKR